MDYSRAESLLSLVAVALTGKSVKVELVDSLDKRLGECFKRNGRYIIRVINKSNYAGVLRIFTHEVAHIKLQANMFIDLKSVNFGMSRIASNMTKSEESEMEEEAEKLSKTWIKYASNNAWRYSGSENEKKLKALLFKDKDQ